MSVWILATETAYTVITATHHAKIDAFLRGVQLPAATVQEGLVAAGLSDKYSKLHAGKSQAITCSTALMSFAAVLLAIFPWIALLFNVIVIVILFAAAQRRDEPETISQMSITAREKGSLDG